MPRPAHHRKQDALGGPPLVCGHHVAEARQRVHHPLEAEETLAARVGFVAFGRAYLTFITQIQMDLGATGIGPPRIVHSD